MRFLPVCAVFLTLGAAPAFAAAADGKVVFDTKCKACHGADGAGNPGIAKMLKVTMRGLGSAEVQAKSDADLKKDITAGNGKMKPVAGLAAKQLDGLVAYVRTLKQ
jgi:mono/diheme cytochrome c family protein